MYFKNIILLTLLFTLLMPFFTQCCLLCNKGSDLQENHERLYCQKNNITQAILFESQHFYVATDNYPVCEDHILIIPKDHKLSYSVIDECVEYELEAIIYTLKDITKTRCYGLFEHGCNMIKTGQKACGNSVYHAHMHFIPNLDMDQGEIIDLCSKGPQELTISLEEGHHFEDCLFHKKDTETVLSFLHRLPTKQPYLFCFFSSYKNMALCISDAIIRNCVPSQFFRRVFAEHFQTTTEAPFWNWKDTNAINRSIDFRKKVTEETIKKFEDKYYVNMLFANHLGSLPR